MKFVAVAEGMAAERNHVPFATGAGRAPANAQLVFQVLSYAFELCTATPLVFTWNICTAGWEPPETQVASNKTVRRYHWDESMGHEMTSFVLPAQAPVLSFVP